MIRDNVKAIREAKGIKATHVGRALGYATPQGYYYLENGQRDISAEKLKVIANLLGEDIGIFFDTELTDLVIKGLEGVKA